jgi:hypothetical protein
MRGGQRSRIAPRSRQWRGPVPPQTFVFPLERRRRRAGFVRPAVACARTQMRTPRAGPSWQNVLSCRACGRGIYRQPEGQKLRASPSTLTTNPPPCPAPKARPIPARGIAPGFPSTPHRRAEGPAHRPLVVRKTDPAPNEFSRAFSPDPLDGPFPWPLAKAGMGPGLCPSSWTKTTPRPHRRSGAEL